MNILTAVKYMIKKYEGKQIRKKELKEIKDYVVEKTGQGKYAGLATVRKWVNKAKKEIKYEKMMKKKKKTANIAEKAKKIREEIYVKPLESEPSPEEKKAVAVLNITYEMAAIRQLLQRINKQLDSIETMLKQFNE